MKAFLALKIRKSVSEKAKSNSLGLVNFGFLDFANLAVVDRFLILLPASLPLASSPVPFDVP